MKNCGNKIKHTCAEKNYATCIYYELDIPTFSDLHGVDCTTIEDTTEDQYNLIGEIKSEIDLSALGEACIEYDVDPKTVKSVLLQYEQEICDLRTKVQTLETTAICDINITGCGLDLTGINNNCSSPVVTLGDLLGYLLDNTTPTP
jgi:hypothetical protein